MNFDRHQLEIIGISEGHHLVLAPPGCGKTAILAARVALALESGIDPSEMLCLSFTNRASRGMLERITDHIGDDVASKIFIGNTHRFCARYLFENQIVAMSTGILDDIDTLSILKELGGMAEVTTLDIKRREYLHQACALSHVIHQFRHCHPRDIIMNADHSVMNMLRELCHEMKCEATKSKIVEIFDSIDEIAGRFGSSPSHGETISLLSLASRYTHYKKENRLIDFDDLLLLTYDSLSVDPDHKRYRWAQVDEVQDLNPLQLAIVSQLISPDKNVVLYLGDEQQSIFSFIGARKSTLDKLKRECDGNIHHLALNYRSPRYLLDVLNTFASANFGTDRNLLPKPYDDTAAGDGDLILKYLPDNEKAVTEAARMAMENYRDERTAIIVATNKDADAISDCLGDTPHFKISGTDFFSTTMMQVIISHLNVISNDHNQIAWAKLIKNLGLTRQSSSARKTVMKLFAAAMTPADLLKYETGSYLTRFVETYGSMTTVLFDTETTGLDVFADDIVQIAAIKIKDGRIIDSLNIIMETGKEIPPMLGDTPNPLVKAYAEADRYHRREGLNKFLEFAAGCTLIAHNIEFDWNILDRNLRRDASVDNLSELLPERFDTLKLTRLVHPRFFSYKLKDLIDALALDGCNSHLADDGIIATKSLADYLFETVTREDFMTRHLDTIKASMKFRQNFSEKYGRIYNRSLNRLYDYGDKDSLINELKFIERQFSDREPEDTRSKKFDYVVKYITEQLAGRGHSVIEQLSLLLTDINTYRESDLCDADIVNENIFVTTVHKAKGLEFDNVIVYGVVDGTYPFFNSKTEEERCEDARKLYVALSRTRRRLTLIAYNYYTFTTAFGRKSFEKTLSPFLRKVTPFFTTVNQR